MPKKKRLDDWIIADVGKVYGPFSWEKVSGYVDRNSITIDAHIMKESEQEWEPITKYFPAHKLHDPHDEGAGTLLMFLILGILPLIIAAAISLTTSGGGDEVLFFPCCFLPLFTILIGFIIIYMLKPRSKMFYAMVIAINCLYLIFFLIILWSSSMV